MGFCSIRSAILEEKKTTIFIAFEKVNHSV